MAKPYFKNEPVVPSFVEMEEQLLKDWNLKGIVKKYLSKNAKAKKKFSFLDGPITANNPMGVHHARGRTYKDLWQRYKTMRGFKQRYQNGFDCQGLWVEVEVEKELGFKNKKDIEKYGVEKFVDQCKARVKKYSDIQTQQSRRLGMWMDWENSYFTMSDENNYAIWNFLKVCHQRGWLYKGHDSVPWCPRCETAISQHEMLTEDYKQVTHQAIYFTLPLKGKSNQFLLVWTTTPWTLPANICVAVDETLDYSLVQIKSGQQFWLLKDLITSVLAEDLDKVIKTVKGKVLVGLKYSGPFDSLPAVAKVNQHPLFHTVIAADPLIMPITVNEGTGLVHTAVSAGTEDYQLGKKLGLPMIPVIQDNADYFDNFGELSGKNAKKHPELIFNYLKSQGNQWIYRLHNYSHRYPACWRCKAELVWKVTDEWYISMKKLRPQIISVTKKIHWIPEFGLDRELDWLNNMHDWLISKKNRYWGLALPIYECAQCRNFEVIGSKTELEQRAVQGWEKFAGHSPHKPWIDEVKISCSKCQAAVSRIEPVGNPWLDAGIVPFSTMPKSWFPAEFITEAFPGQFKNWFYAMLVMATVLKKTNPFKTVLGYESVVGEDGRPMHKSWGNAIEFNEGAQKIGVDVMRWIYASVLPTAVLPFGYKAGAEIKRRFFLILWNSYRFFVSQAQAQRWLPPAGIPDNSHILDKWILSRLQNTILTVTASLDKFYSATAAESLEKFVSDFSTWYIRRSRDRMADANCLHTMYFCLVTLSELLAPFIPYLSDYLYQQLTKKTSVHLSDWPKINPALINQSLETNMVKARELVEKIHSQRKALNLKVRQPLTSVIVKEKSFGDAELWQIILDEINIKKIKFSGEKGDGSVKLDTKLTPALKAEGQTRDLIRSIQEARKLAGTDLTEFINLELPDWPKEFEKEIKHKTLVKKLIKGPKLKLIRL